MKRNNKTNYSFQKNVVNLKKHVFTLVFYLIKK